MKQDKFLIGILAGIGLLMIVAVVVVLVRAPGSEEYMADDSPEGVVHNYFLALQREEYERAYGYLSESLADRPNLDEFIADIQNGAGNQEASLRVGEVTVNNDRAQVDITLTTYQSGDIFESSRYSREETALLRQEGGAWKINQFPYPYWAWNWTNED